jgi:cAMP-dependent protein kinase regulator
VEDHDLAFGDVEPMVLEPDPEIVVEPEPVVEPVVEVALEPDPLNDDLFAQELLSVIDGVFPGSAEEAAAADKDGDQTGSARQIVVSPLFRDFSVDEMVAVIQGLQLHTYDAGEIIIGEGEPGESMYMLTAGRVKAFKRNTAGRNAPLGEMSEGAFFGEISVLTGQPRTATVIAATPCELLELDRKALDEIAHAHPHVMDVLREHADKRL